MAQTDNPLAEQLRFITLEADFFLVWHDYVGSIGALIDKYKFAAAILNTGVGPGYAAVIDHHVVQLRRTARLSVSEPLVCRRQRPR